MRNRSRLWALLGAAVLTFGIAGIVLATDLQVNQAGTTLSGYFDEEKCADWPETLPIGAGEVGIHFILTSPAANSGKLSATFSNPNSSVSDVDNWPSPAEALHWYIVISGSGDTVIESASTDVNGNNLVVSHACPGETTTTTTTTTEETTTTTEETTTTTEETTTTTEETTTTTTFTQETSGETDEPTLPPTSTVGGGNSGPSEGSWLLVALLGAFLAGAVILTPARAKSQR